VWYLVALPCLCVYVSVSPDDLSAAFSIECCREEMGIRDSLIGNAVRS
jgi:hypothetical protein